VVCITVSKVTLLYVANVMDCKSRKLIQSKRLLKKSTRQLHAVKHFQTEHMTER